VSTGLGLATDGYYGAGGGATDSDVPEIAAVSPTPGVAPGEPGGFPNVRRDAEVMPVELLVSDDDSGIAYVSITLRVYGDDATYGTEHVVYRDAEFKSPFRESSTSGTVQELAFEIVRTGGWAGRYLEFSVDAIDAAGNKTSVMYIYELPAGVTEIDDEDVDEGDELIETIDHVARALDRLPQQHRGEDDE